MLEQFAPLIILALVIIGAIAGTAFLIWHLSSDTLRADRIKRSNRCRRRSGR